MLLPLLTPATSLLVWAMVAHVIGDWLLQTEWMAVNKCSLRHPAGYVHAGVYAVCMLAVFTWPFALAIGVIHLLVDTRTPVQWWLHGIKRVPPGHATRLVEMAIDQSFHVVTIALAALLVVQVR